MSTSAYFPGLKRHGNHPQARPRLSFSSSLPVHSSFSSSAVQEKYARQSQLSPWWISFAVPIPFPCVRTRFLHFCVLNPRRAYHFSVSRFGRKRGSFLLLITFMGALFMFLMLVKRFGVHAKRLGTQAKSWQTPFTGDPPTLVFQREDLQRIWKWEVASGHYPSRRNVPQQLRLETALINPAVPPRRETKPSRFTPPPGPYKIHTLGVGPTRIYLDIQSVYPDVSYPPRPVPGSVADLDIVMEHCDFSQNKFVRDCLEVLRVGAGLDNGKRVRRGRLDTWKYIYIEQTHNTTQTTNLREDEVYQNKRTIAESPNYGLSKRRGTPWESSLRLPPPLGHTSYASLPAPCDPENPRLFHMYWTGSFTDKPYLALLSFLFTQNLGLHTHDEATLASKCRPQLWLWINPGPAAAVMPHPDAEKDMFAQLRKSPWAAPFLHPRFQHLIQFKLWNTTEQLDGVPEIKNEWRSKNLFVSHGVTYSVPSSKAQETMQPGETVTEKHAAENDDLVNRSGSKSLQTYDLLSVILSDLARFVLCHRFGGIYLDADTLFLRDWEELLGWKGAYAYRWSRMKVYNTAVLHLNKNSALGTFLFRTALKNSMDFHPMTVANYMKDAYMEELLLRLPDALFDSAWLTTEEYQLSRPPQPFFTSFEQFFKTPAVGSAAPQALGFDGFFKGAFSYHFHNSWWKPFDPSRNWPDLGPRFAEGERKARLSLKENITTAGIETEQDEEDSVENDRRDLDWSTVIKRTFESYIRGERPNMYGEWLQW